MSKNKLLCIFSGGDAHGASCLYELLAQHQRQWNIHTTAGGYKGCQKPLQPLVKNGYPIFGRYPLFEYTTTQTSVVKKLKQAGITHIWVFGGNGSSQGASVLAKHFNVLFTPLTIDDNVPNATSIGCDSAIKYGVDYCQRMLETARSNQTHHVIEVMGDGSIALIMGIVNKLVEASDSNIAPAITVITTDKPNYPELITKLKQREKIIAEQYSLVLVLERSKQKDARAQELYKLIKPHVNNVRHNTIGHAIRNGPKQSLSPVDYAMCCNIIARGFEVLNQRTNNHHGLTTLMITELNNAVVTQALPTANEKKHHDMLIQTAISHGITVL